MRPQPKMRLEALALACFVLPVASAVALDRPAAAEPPANMASRGLTRDDTPISGGPVLISRADTESPLTRVRRVEMLDTIELEATAEPDPAFKALVLTPRGSTGRPLQPAPAGLDIIDTVEAPPKPEKALEKPEKAPEKRENNPTRPTTVFRLQSTPEPTPKDAPTDKVRPRDEHKGKQLATIPDVKSVASPPPRPAPGPKTAASAPPAPPRSFGPADIGAARAMTRF